MVNVDNHYHIILCMPCTWARDEHVDDISLHTYIHTHTQRKYRQFSHVWFMWGSLWLAPIVEVHQLTPQLYTLNVIPLSGCSFASFSNRGWSTLLTAFSSVFHEGRLCFSVRIHCIRASFHKAVLSSELFSLIVVIVLNDNPKSVHSCCHFAASELQAMATSFQSSSPEMWEISYITKHKCSSCTLTKGGVINS